jgi:hypothetical protein
MHIDSYRFGKVVIDGTAYNSDCLIINGSVQPDWWRRQGHVLDVDDLQAVIVERPATLVVGCGASGLMKISEETRQVLEQNEIELIALDTHSAVSRFNELVGSRKDVAAALHLTC